MKEKKPFSIAIRETQNKIVNMFNESELPLDAMIPILKDLLNVITIQAEEQYQKELKSWNEKQNENSQKD